jgi:hypothetical protein
MAFLAFKLRQERERKREREKKMIKGLPHASRSVNEKVKRKKRKVTSEGEGGKKGLAIADPMDRVYVPIEPGLPQRG